VWHKTSHSLTPLEIGVGLHRPVQAPVRKARSFSDCQDCVATRPEADGLLRLLSTPLLLRLDSTVSHTRLKVR
jgi:hypothetical protein